MRLSYEHLVIRLNKPKQYMIISVDYAPHDDSFDNIQVEVYEDDKFMCEISDLLDRAEGYPLAAMVESIDWREVYRNSEHYEGEIEDYEVSEPTYHKFDMER